MAETQIYTVDTPDGKVIELEGPVGASEETVLNSARELYNAQLQSQQTAEQPVSTEPDYANMSGLEVAGRAIQNAPRDVADLAVGTVKAVADPVGTTTGVIDLASAGMSKVLDFTGLSKYADPEKMARYRTLRGHIADQVSDTFTKEGLKKRISEKPVTSLLDVSLAGQAVTAPVKATRYGGMANQLMKSIDPVQGGAKVSGMLYDKAKDVAAVRQSQNAPRAATAKKSVESGYTITPSESGGAGVVTSTLEGISKKATRNKAIDLNQKNTDRLIREHTNVPKDTALDDILDVVDKRSSPAYEAIGKLKPQVISKRQVIPQTTKSPLGTVSEAAPKIIPAKRTKSGAKILSEWKKTNAEAKKEFNLQFKKQEKGQPTDFTKANNLKAKAESLTSQMEQIARLSKQKGLVDNLKKARIDYAKAYNMQDAITPTGNLDARLFAKKNRGNKALDGAGKSIVDFADSFPTLVGKKQSTLLDTIKSSAALTATPLTLGPALLTSLGAMTTAPMLLGTRLVQGSLKNPNYMPFKGTSSLLGPLSKTPTSAVAVPSLLDRTDVEYIQDLQL